MSAGTGTDSSSSYLSQLLSLVWQSLAQLVRAPSHSRRAEAGRHWAKRSLAIATVTGIAIVVLMYALDATEIGLMPPRGTAWLWPVRMITDLGKSNYVLWTLAGLLVVLALIAPRLQGHARAVLISITTRVAFVFLAVLAPVLTGEIVKGIVGRGRPFVGGKADPFNFSHFAWTEAYAAFPSGLP